MKIGKCRKIGDLYGGLWTFYFVISFSASSLQTRNFEFTNLKFQVYSKFRVYKHEISSFQTQNFEFTNTKFRVNKLEILIFKLEILSFKLKILSFKLEFRVCKLEISCL